jgi:hypothetical protein
MRARQARSDSSDARCGLPARYRSRGNPKNQPCWREWWVCRRVGVQGTQRGLAMDMRPAALENRLSRHSPTAAGSGKGTRRPKVPTFDSGSPSLAAWRRAGVVANDGSRLRPSDQLAACFGTRHFQCPRTRALDAGATDGPITATERSTLLRPAIPMPGVKRCREVGRGRHLNLGPLWISNGGSFERRTGLLQKASPLLFA